MRHECIRIILYFFVITTSFVIYFRPIYQNKVIFFSDEMYWIQTARILPYIWDGRFKDSYWKEHVGFTNFYGAKWIYAIGMRLFGHTDFSLIKYPLGHIDQFKDQDSTYFSRENRFYSFVYHGRVISAIMASFAIGMMFLYTITVFPRQWLAGLFASFLLANHPTVVYVATHALADSMFLFGEVTTLLLLARLWNECKKMRFVEYMLLGVSLAFVAAVKINGVMMFGLFMLVLAFKTMQKLNGINLMKIFAWVSSITLFIFICLHPHVFFYPNYSFVRMVQERIYITHQQFDYYTVHDPSHVLWNSKQKIQSMVRYVFWLPIAIGCIGALLWGTYRLIRKSVVYTIGNYSLQWISMFFIYAYIFGYVIFDDERYFMPLLPFVCLISVFLIQKYSVDK